jgi:hypothetical protein
MKMCATGLVENTIALGFKLRKTVCWHTLSLRRLFFKLKNHCSMDKKQQVLLKLKPKVKAFGFNKKELMSVAAKIADNLTSTEDASEEDVNAEIDAAIDAVLPYLQVSQSFANRVIEESRKKNDDDETDDDDDDESSNKTNRQAGSNKKNQKNEGKNDDAPEWAKGMMQTIQTLNNEITALKGDKVTTTRRSKLENVLKDTGTFGTRTLKSFGKMKFENDEEFEEFLSEVADDLKAYNQERADAGLSEMTTPPAGGGGKGQKQNEVLTDDEINALANALIVVAGMRYAELVEAIESKDVLAGPELFARRKLPEMEVKLNTQIARIIA